MPIEKERIRFEPVALTHLPILHEWLKRPHMREWWGDPDEELGFISDMVEGRDTTRPFLIHLDGVPVGYIQYWFIGHHQNEQWLPEHPWLLEFPDSTVGIDISIGDVANLSKGVGSAAISLMVQKLIDAGHGPIIIDPDPKNLRAVRAYTKAGFRSVPHLEGRTKDVLIMQYEANSNEIEQ